MTALSGEIREKVCSGSMPFGSDGYSDVLSYTVAEVMHEAAVGAVVRRVRIFNDATWEMMDAWHS